MLRSLEMQVKVNGKLRDVDDETTLASLVEALGLGRRQVVVEHNGEAVDRERLALVRLGSGDVVEIVRAVEGG